MRAAFWGNVTVTVLFAQAPASSADVRRRSGSGALVFFLICGVRFVRWLAAGVLRRSPAASSSVAHCGVASLSLLCRSSVAPMPLFSRFAVAPLSLLCCSAAARLCRLCRFAVAPLSLLCSSSVAPLALLCRSSVAPLSLRVRSAGGPPSLICRPAVASLSSLLCRSSAARL